MNSMKRTKIIAMWLLLAVMLMSLFALVACDKVPEKYKMKNFYGTYDQFANDYFTVYFTLNGESGTTELTVGWWDICELKENSFVYIDTTGEKKEKECDAVLIAKIRELQQRIGHKVKLERKRMTFVESNTVVKFDKIKTQYSGQFYYVGAYDKAGENLLGAFYENENTDDERKIVSVVAKEMSINCQGNSWDLVMTKKFC